jgi:parvulin-like peptidyl-prolyl isomerase
VIRPTRLAGVLAALALVVSSCSADVPRGAAATVDGVEVPREVIEVWVRDALTANSLLDEGQVQRELLSWVIQRDIVANVLRERGLEITAEEVAEVRSSVIASIGGEGALPGILANVGFPQDFFDQVFLVREAGIDAIVLQLTGDRVLETRTARHVLVATAEEAAAVIEALGAGADFAELALERSIDTGSGARGGDLGPQSRGVFVPEFDAAVWSARLGTVLEPVETEFGFHVIEVMAEDRRAAAELSSLERRGLVGEALDLVLGEALARATVVVDGRLGSWDPITGAVVATPTVGSVRG